MILFQQVKCTERFTFLHKTKNKITDILHKIQITTLDEMKLSEEKIHNIKFMVKRVIIEFLNKLLFFNSSSIKEHDLALKNLLFFSII